MPKNKHPMNLSDHYRASACIHLANEAVAYMQNNIIQYHLRKDSREIRMTRRVLKDINQLQMMLDDIVCIERPDGIGDLWGRVYYGPHCEYEQEDIEALINGNARTIESRVLEMSHEDGFDD